MGDAILLFVEKRKVRGEWRDNTSWTYIDIVSTWNVEWFLLDCSSEQVVDLNKNMYVVHRM